MIYYYFYYCVCATCVRVHFGGHYRPTTIRTEDHHHHHPSSGCIVKVVHPGLDPASVGIAISRCAISYFAFGLRVYYEPTRFSNSHSLNLKLLINPFALISNRPSFAAAHLPPSPFKMKFNHFPCSVCVVLRCLYMVLVGFAFVGVRINLPLKMNGCNVIFNAS